MPHECTACGRAFPDGSKEMLSGCPDCGGNKFQFQPNDAVDATASAGDQRGVDASESPDNVRRPGDARTGRPSPPPSDDDDIIEADETPITGPEDSAQADARSGFVTPDEVADGEEEPAADTGPTDSSVDTRAGREDAPADSSRSRADGDASVGSVDKQASDISGDELRPDLDDLRAELNEQFESIRIVDPGTYELNLMELYDREEHIISLREDGRYVIEVPETWRNG